MPSISLDSGVRGVRQQALAKAQENLDLTRGAAEDERAMERFDGLLDRLEDLYRTKKFICEPEWRFKGGGTRTRSGNGVGVQGAGSFPIKTFGAKPAGAGGVGVAVPGFTLTQNAPSSASDSNLVVLSVVGEVGFVRIYGGTLTSFLGGPRFTMLLPTQRFTPFFALLAGLERGFGASAFALQPAGGITMPLNDRAHLVGELAFRLFPTADFGSETQIRFSGGVAFSLGTTQ